nr:kinesin-like protein KIN-14R [Ipomoea batatas]
MEKQALKLTEISSRYEHDKQVWRGAISNLEQKVKIMKQEHSQLSRDAHECVDSIPDLSKMVFAVQSLVEQCEDLKFKYNEEQAKRRKLFNEVQEAKGALNVFCLYLSDIA